MATFLARALHLPAATRDYFIDDNHDPRQADINKVAQAGITTGCSAKRFCADGAVSRAQMATFLARALALPISAHDYFRDDHGGSHEADINRLAQSGITSGCSAHLFCPLGHVSRGQMAAFLHRAFGG
jgi:hypothetical protein